MKSIFPLVLAAVLGLPAMGAITVVDDFSSNNFALVNTTTSRARIGDPTILGGTMTVSFPVVGGFAGVSGGVSTVSFPAPSTGSVVYGFGSLSLITPTNFDLSGVADGDAVSFGLGLPFSDSVNVLVEADAGGITTIGNLTIAADHRIILPIAANTTGFRITITPSSDNVIIPGVIATIDDIQVIPEPTRAVLLGLVGAGFLLRRRRK